MPTRGAGDERRPFPAALAGSVNEAPYNHYHDGGR